MGNSLIWIIVAFALYLLMMIAIGAVYAKKNNSAEDYFLGGRQLNGFVAALSAQASDMSGWLLMGLPGSVYALGTGQSWIAIGLFIGTVCNWLFISGKLRRYTIRANNSLTLPTYFENRFHDKKRILLLISSITIVIFAVCVTDFIQGNLMLIGLLVVPLAAWGIVGTGNVANLLESSGAVGGAAGFLSLVNDGTGTYSAVDIISQLAWGLGYCGMPHILVRFMAVRDEKELKKSKGIAIGWVALSLFFAVIIGVIGRAYLYPELLTDGAEENVFIHMIIKLFTQDVKAPIIGGIFLCGILAAIMSTADSQLLVSASSMAEDIFKGVVKKDADDKTVLRISRITVLVIAVLAYIIALNPNSSIMELVSNAWAGLGSAFGPTVLMSLYWRRTNLQGAVAGIAVGALTVIVWDYIPFVSGQTLGAVTGLYSLAVGFALSLAAIVAVSLLTPAPDAEMLREFDDVKMKK